MGRGQAFQGTESWLHIHKVVFWVLCAVIYLGQVIEPFFFFFRDFCNQWEVESLIIKDCSSCHFYKSNYYLIQWGSNLV